MSCSFILFSLKIFFERLTFEERQGRVIASVGLFLTYKLAVQGCFVTPSFCWMQNFSDFAVLL